MKTQYLTATSLDGFIATQDDSLDWLFPLADMHETGYPEFIGEVGALVMGASTYEWIRRNADLIAATTGSAWPYEQPVWVFSTRTHEGVPGADIRFVRGDVREVHLAMRQAAGAKNIWVVGGGDIAVQFFDAGLLDELIIHVGSVTLGRGKALFPRRVLHPHLRLVSTRQVGSGMATLRYAICHSGPGL